MSERIKIKEDVKVPDRSFDFSIIRPGGNDTALIEGIPGDMRTRKRLNDAIMGIYPNVEQVGFVNLDPNDPELMMAGGEFCGNATRSAAWKVLKRKPGELEIKVSGVDQKLKAGVSESGEAYAQMPVYNDVSYIQRDPKKPMNYMVEMKGITHYVDFNSEQISGLTEAEIKEKVRIDLRKRKLDELPAAGIIFTEKQGVRDYKITPVVYVRDMDTLFVETACGSGTAALGLAIAKESGSSVSDLPIYQPSGLPIKVSAEYSGNKIGYTQIRGKVSELYNGTLETAKGKSFAVEHLSAQAKLQHALSDRGLRDAYRDAFGRPPYNELYADREIDDMFKDYQRDGHVFVAVDGGKVIAFSATQPLSSVPDIGELLAGCPGINPDSWYIPDLGIRAEYEGNGIAKDLMDKALRAVPASVITLRTSVDNYRSQKLYKGLGFNIVPGLYQEIEQKRLNGEPEVDRRLFMVLNRKIK